MKYFSLILLSIILINVQLYAQKRPIDKSLFNAIKTNNIAEVKKLIKLSANVNAQGENGSTALMWAIYKSDIKMVQLLVKSGADTKAKGIIYLNDEKTSFYGSPLSIAAGEGKLELVKYLIEKCNISVNDKQLTAENKENGWGALHEACMNGHIEIIEYFFSKGADKNLQSIEFFKPKGPTPLICAVRSNKIDVVKIILNKNPRIDAVDEIDISALGYAILNNNPEIVKLLVNAGADVNLPIFKGAGYLMFAAYANSNESFKYLVWKGSKPDKTNLIYLDDVYVYTLTGMAAARGNIDLLSYCLDSLKLDIDQNSLIVDEKQIVVSSPLQIAILTKQTAAAEFLINKGANINLAENNYGLTPLHYAAYKNLPDLCRLLIQKGANINQQSKEGYTALYLAARDGYEDIYKYLIEKGADPTLTDKNGKGPCFYAWSKNQIWLKNFLQPKLAAPENSWKQPQSLLYQIILADNKLTADSLMKIGLKTDIPDANGYIAINYAILSKNLEIVELVLKYNKKINVTTGNITPLCQAIQTDRDIAKLLIEMGADVNQKTPEGSFPIFYALNDSVLTTLNLLLLKGASLNLVNDNGWQTLHFAIKTNRLLSVKALVAAGVDVNLKNKEGLNALDYSKKENADRLIIEFLTNLKIDPYELLENNMDFCLIKTIEKNPAICEQKSSDGYPFLHKLVLNNKLNILKAIGLNKVNLNVTDSLGRTPLYYAILIGNTEIAKQLIAIG